MYKALQALKESRLIDAFDRSTMSGKFLYRIGKNWRKANETEVLSIAKSDSTLKKRLRNEITATYINFYTFISISSLLFTFITFIYLVNISKKDYAQIISSH